MEGGGEEEKIYPPLLYTVLDGFSPMLHKLKGRFVLP